MSHLGRRGQEQGDSSPFTPQTHIRPRSQKAKNVPMPNGVKKKNHNDRTDVSYLEWFVGFISAFPPGKEKAFQALYVVPWPKKEVHFRGTAQHVLQCRTRESYFIAGVDEIAARRTFFFFWTPLDQSFLFFFLFRKVKMTDTKEEHFKRAIA